jgi:hypothetical protein
VGLLGTWQLFVFKNEKAISQCEKILLDQIESIQDSGDISRVFMENIQSDIRALIYIGGVLSNNERIIDCLNDYYMKFADELNSNGFFDEATNLHTSLMFTQTEQSVKIRKTILICFSVQSYPQIDPQFQIFSDKIKLSSKSA